MQFCIIVINKYRLISVGMCFFFYDYGLLILARFCGSHVFKPAYSEGIILY